MNAQKNLGGSILVYVPSKGRISQMNGLVAQLARQRGVVVGTKRDRANGWRGGPVLAAWPTRETLAEIVDDPRVTALCVIPWIAGQVDAWAAAAQPELLGGATAAATAVLHPVVEAGMRSLTRMVNHSNNLAGALDHRDAVATIRTLHDNGYPPPPDDIYSWALANGWPSRGAERLRELLERTASGVRLQLKGGMPYRSDILDVWRKEAAGG